jgi:ribosomal protein L28
VQHVHVRLPSGETRRLWVCAKALKANKICKA